MRLRHLLAVPLALLLGRALSAQERLPPVDEPGRFAPIFGLCVGGPQKASVYGGAALVIAGDRHGYTGVSLLAEPGLGAGQLSLGLTSFGEAVSVLRVQGSVLRTWRDPWFAAPRQTFLGADLHFGAMLVGLSAGAYWRLVGSAPGDERLVTLSLVLGL